MTKKKNMKKYGTLYLKVEFHWNSDPVLSLVDCQLKNY